MYIRKKKSLKTPDKQGSQPLKTFILFVSIYLKTLFQRNFILKFLY